MNLLFAYTLFLGSLATVAKEPIWVEISKTGTTKKIFLMGSNCIDLEKEAIAIALWTERVGERPSSPQCECPSSTCQLEITDVTPEMVNKLTGLYAKDHGPNCWNAALVASKVADPPLIKSTHPMEWSLMLNSPLCRKRGPEEALQPGDIAAIRKDPAHIVEDYIPEPDTEPQYRKFEIETHGFIYISPSISFSKNGIGKDRPYVLTSTKDVLREYHVYEECDRGFEKKIQCAEYSEYYDCMTWSEGLSRNLFKEDAFYLSYHNDLLEIEKSLDAVVGPLATLSPHDTFISDLYRKLIQLHSKAKQVTRDDFLWKSILVRMDSAFGQLPNPQNRP